jgi:hypothetical protein
MECHHVVVVVVVNVDGRERSHSDIPMGLFTERPWFGNGLEAVGLKRSPLQWRVECLSAPKLPYI